MLYFDVTRQCTSVSLMAEVADFTQRLAGEVLVLCRTAHGTTQLHYAMLPCHMSAVNCAQQGASSP
jgi:hypothetical protein